MVSDNQIISDKAEEENIREIKELYGKLEEGVRKVFYSDNYKKCLDLISRFSKYSFNNTVLILEQCPRATFVASFLSWKKNFNRNVRKGAKGIKIFAPITSTQKKNDDELDDKEKKAKELAAKNNGKLFLAHGTNLILSSDIYQNTVYEGYAHGYRIMYVFDISQTEGDPLPILGYDELSGSVNSYERILHILKKISPVPISFENFSTGTYSQYRDGHIALNNKMSQPQTFRTAIYEIARASLLLSPKTKKQLKKVPDPDTLKVQAESIAYAVCSRLGLDTSDFSFEYVAKWAARMQKEELNRSMGKMVKVAHALNQKIIEENNRLSNAESL